MEYTVTNKKLNRKRMGEQKDVEMVKLDVTLINKSIYSQIVLCFKGLVY